jgi:transcriptional regulator with XRE-family HTH domain
MQRANGHAIRAIRERTGMTQALLARETGIDPAIINRLELGTRSAKSSPDVLVKIAQALKVPLTAIIHEC